MPETKKANWSAIRKRLSDFEKSELLALVKDLFDASPANREFLHARFQTAEDGNAALENYRQKIVEQFYPKRGFGKLKLADARKAIRDYSNASNDLAGTLDLMLTFVETGTKFTNDFGDVDEPFYDSLESVLDDLSRQLQSKGVALYPQFQERIQALAEDADIGWGYGDHLRETVAELDEKLGGDSESSGAENATVS